MSLSTRPLPWPLVLFIVLTLPLGCMPAVEQRVQYPQSHAPEEVALPLQVVEDQIMELESALASGRLGDKSRDAAEDLLSEYRSLRAILLAGAPETRAGQETYRRSLRDLVRVQKRYISEDLAARGAHSALSHEYLEKRKAVLDDFYYENEQAVIEGVRQLEKRYGPDALTPEINRILALALAREGRMQEAVEAGNRAARDPGMGLDLVTLRSRLVEWEMGLGHRNSAMATYEKLLADMEEGKRSVERARRALSIKTAPDLKRAPQDGFARQKGVVPPPSDDVGMHIDDLIQREEFERAKILLIQKKLRTPEGPEREALERAFSRVEEAEKDAAGTPPAEGVQADAHGAEVLARARTLIAQEKYEEALAWLNISEGNLRMSAEARGLKGAAIEEIVIRERNRAAELFLIARSSSDPLAKRENLIKSRNILKSLIEKYPLTPSYKKIKDNIESVEAALRELEGGASR